MPESAPIKRKLLSFATGVRNDQYIDNYSWRVSTILNYIAFGLEQINRLDDVEIIIVDWNSPTPMASELNLSAAAQKIACFVDVPPDIANPAQRGIPFPTSVIFNSSLRRASGEFIGVTDNDCLYTPASLDILCRLLEGSLKIGADLRKAYMPIARRKLAREFTLCCPGVSEIDHYLNHYADMIDEDRIYNGTVGSAGSLIMHRDLWEECGGLDEQALNWGWSDIDLTLRSTRRYPWINLSNFGIMVFHMEHPLTYVKEKTAGKKKTVKVNVHQIPHPFNLKLNGADWGLGQYELTQYGWSAGSGNIPQTSQDWRLKKLEGCSRKTVQEQLVSPETRKSVLDFLNWVCQIPPYKLPGGRHAIRQIQALIDQHNHKDWDFLNAIAWYTKNFLPLSYIESGLGRGLASFLAVSLYPPISIYGFESWDPFDNPLAVHPLVLGQILGEAKHCGYLRIISEQTSEAYHMFWDQPDSPSAGDLIIYTNAYSAERVINEALPLIRHLAKGGCFVLQHPDPAIFRKVSSALQKETPELAWFIGNRCAMALNTGGSPDWTKDAGPAVLAKEEPSSSFSPLSLKDVTTRAEHFLQEGREDEAVLLINSQIQLNPQDAGLYLLMGKMLSKLNLQRNAVYFFQQSVALDPDEMAGYANLTVALATVADFSEAEKVLLGYLQKFPTQPVMIRLLGDVLAAQNRPLEALETYEKGLALNPNDIEGLSGLANCAIELGELVRAQDALNALRKLRPGVPEIEKKWNQLNQRLATASEMVKKILSTKNIATTIQQNIAGISEDVVYLIRLSARQIGAQGDSEIAASYETLAQSLQNLLDSRLQSQ